jgi:hypothetical protein
MNFRYRPHRIPACNAAIRQGSDSIDNLRLQRVGATVNFRRKENRKAGASFLEQGYLPVRSICR